MRLDARTATAKDFDIAAQKHANAFWFYLVLAVVIFYFFKFWAIIPGILAIYTAIQSIGATKAASSLRNGTYKIPNPNNGAPDGDIRNYK